MTSTNALLLLLIISFTRTLSPSARREPAPRRSARRPRVGAEVRVLQPLRRQLRVQLRGRQVRVPQHLLQRAQITAARQQMRGQGVAQRVRAHARLQPSSARVALNDLVQALAAQRAAAVIDEQPSLRARSQERRAAPAAPLPGRARSTPRVADGDRTSARTPPCAPASPPTPLPRAPR